MNLQMNEDEPIIESGADDKEVCQQIQDLLEKNFNLENQVNLLTQIPSLEKEDDHNGHIWFITTVSNLRAQNFGISTGNFNDDFFQEVKGKRKPIHSFFFLMTF